MTVPRAALVTLAADDTDAFWRAAHAFDQRDIPPEAAVFETRDGTADLFGTPTNDANEISGHSTAISFARDYGISDAFLEFANIALLHSEPQRFRLIYRLKRRLRAEPHLLSIASDPDVANARALQRSVRRDMHKMTAFVRFRQIVADGAPLFVAWFEPDHHIVAATAPFFMRRFANMRWSILTPRRSAHWDLEHLVIGDGAARTDAPIGDPIEDVWRTYYANIFNPARLKVQAMRTEMPQKYWRNLPEAELIAPLVQSARRRAQSMIAAPPTVTRRTMPRAHVERELYGSECDTSELEMQKLATPRAAPEATLQALAVEETACRRCPLFAPATQVVPGQGAARARLMFVGEQPGDQEDIAGQPFVGPAGKVFNIALERVGIDRAACFVTNAVKHFKFEPRGKRRLHKKPNTSEIDHCRWWLDSERTLVRPELIIAMGATAAHGILGKTITVSSVRGQIQALNDREHLLVTVHPSYLLRLTDENEKRIQWRAFLADLAAAKTWLDEHSAHADAIS